MPRDGRTDVPTDIKKIIATSRDFANEPKDLQFDG